MRGEEIGCSSSCTKSFEKGTVVHLKAIPFPNARFVKWKVDGQPHAGVITIEGDTVVSALFERKAEAPQNELQLTWYNWNSPEYGTIALDEMAVFLEECEKWGATSEEAYQAAIQEILQTFYPQAELRKMRCLMNDISKSGN
ncbi:hypothetical protein U27_01215 [Candidatus Vecturithrix granuli]|uniref:Bacterial repeat domain-containing protein n=1 Tax=Vecturithrix granuli TaxID=1499967 RepID=A0A081C9R0_VECG1|nr:hypothetical protein U27_01215 [Candidatus Vecturithrix granuli]